VDWTRDGYTITTDPDRIDRSAVRRFLADSYWAADRPAEVIDRSLDRSLAFALIHDGRQVGMARALEVVGLPLEGRHHRGDDDSWNIAALVLHMVDRGDWR